MSEIIQDGTGTKFKAKVDKDARLHVNSVIRTQSQQAILLGYGYNVGSGVVTLTDASESGVFYLKYNGNNIFVIREILAILGSTDGSGNGTVRIYKNPTTGTLISNKTAVSTNENRDFSSSNTLDANIYKGQQGATITDGTNFATTSRSNFSSPIDFDADLIVLRKGNSIAVSYQPPTSNTSQTAIIACTCFEETATID